VKTLIEVHGNDGGSKLAAAKSAVLRGDPDAEIGEARFTGERCPHGRPLVEVTYEPGITASE
jgi:hypothetical protein